MNAQTYMIKTAQIIDALTADTGLVLMKMNCEEGQWRAELYKDGLDTNICFEPDVVEAMVPEDHVLTDSAEYKSVVRSINERYQV